MDFTSVSEVEFLDYLDKVDEVTNIVDEIVSFDTFWLDFNTNNPFLGNIIKDIYEKEKEKFDEKTIMERLETGLLMKNLNELAFLEVNKEIQLEKEKEEKTKLEEMMTKMQEQPIEIKARSR